MYESFSWVISGAWGTPVALRISSGLSAIASALTLAILAFRLTNAGKDAVIGKIRTLGELFHQGGALIVRAAILLWLISQWPSITGNIQSTQQDLSATVIGSASRPDAIARRALRTMDYYETLIANGITAWAAHPDQQTPSVTVPIEPGSSIQSVLAEINQFIEAMMRVPGIMANYAISVMAAIALWVLSAVVIASMAMPMLLLFIALALGPLVVATYMSEDGLSRELSAGWLDIALTTVLAVPILMVLIVLLEPVLSGAASSTLLTESAPGRMVQVGRDFSMLLFFATFLAMPLAIANGIVNGRVPSVNPTLMMLAIVWRLCGRSLSGLARSARASRK